MGESQGKSVKKVIVNGVRGSEKLSMMRTGRCKYMIFVCKSTLIRVLDWKLECGRLMSVSEVKNVKQ